MSVCLELNADECDWSAITEVGGNEVGDVGEAKFESFVGHGEEFKFHFKSNEEQLKCVS